MHTTMEPSQQQPPSLSNNQQTFEFEPETDHDVLRDPVGSFAEDSPQRNASSEDDEKTHPTKRRSPQASPSSSRQPPQYQQHPPYSRPYQHYPPPPLHYHHGHPPPPPHHHQHAQPGTTAHYVYYPPPYHHAGHGPPPTHPPPYPPPPHHHHHHHHHPHSYQQSYYPPPQPAPPETNMDWNSPPPLPTPTIDDTYTPPSTSKRPKSPIQLPPSASKTDSATKLASTPEKPTRKVGGNPFRSPPSSLKLRGSPLFSTSPHSATLGSFGLMDTPAGTLEAELSPMGTPFASGFRLEVGGESLSSPLVSNAITERDFPSVSSDHRASKPEQSPYSGYLTGDFSPFVPPGGLQGVPRSPVRSERRDADRSRSSSVKEEARERSSTASKPPPLPPPSLQPPSRPSSASETETEPPARQSTSSRHSAAAKPPNPPSEVKPRTLWQDSGGAGTAMRLELGHVGQRLPLTQRSFEGINSRMRAQSEHPATQPAYPPPPPRPDSRTGSSYYGRQPPSYPPPASGAPPPAPGPPPHRGPYGRPPSATPGNNVPPPQGYHHSRMMGRATPGVPPNLPIPYVTSSTGHTANMPPVTGKENPKRLPCNCKKSNCLKLYCECFSAQRYCEGCNCANCYNIPAHESKREKAIKETRAKNPKAFEPRISGGQHVGCKCKRSECLKKYCECFQAGILCGEKCKCTGCMNKAGSQKLIDKRRKMKDTRGAEFAMRVAEETWKGQPSTSRKAPSTAPSMRAPMPSPAMQPPYSRPPPHYMGRSMMGSIGYSPMGIPTVTPGYEMSHFPAPPPSTKTSGTKRSASASGVSSTPRQPRAIRQPFDASSSRKRRKTASGEEETASYFGELLPPQPKTVALNVFSYFSNKDAFLAAQVCRSWRSLAKDEELWKFDVSK